MAQRILGIDLGARTVKLVLLQSTFRAFTVLDHVRAELPPAGEPPGAPLLARQAAALGELLAARAWPLDEAVVALPGSGISSAVITLPFTDPHRIEQTLPFEVEGQIPFELSAVAWDWQSLGVREGRSDLLVDVVRREEVTALLAALGPLGIDPRWVLPPGPAYAALLSSGAAGAPPAPGADPQVEVVVDVGQERTSVCVVAAGACEAARTFSFGVGQLARALARDLSRPEPDGHALIAAELGTPLPPQLAPLAADPRAAEAVRRALAPLIRELRATLRGWRARVGSRRVARLLLAGELARLPGLPEILAPEVDGGVAPLTLTGPAAQAIPDEEAPGYALALALALRGHQGARGPRLNLRRGELAFTRDFEHLKGRVTRLAAAAVLVLVLAAASAGVVVFTLSHQESLLDRALCDAEQKIIGKCFANFEEAQAVLRGRGTAGGALPRASAVDLLAELSERLPADVKVRLERVEVTRDKLHVEGATDSAAGVDRLVSGLRTSRCFTEARSGSARKRADGRFEFSIDTGLTCLDTGPGAAPGGKG